MTIDTNSVGTDAHEAAKRLISDAYGWAKDYNDEDHDDPERKQLIEDQLLVARAVGDLSQLVRRLSRELRRVFPDSKHADQADDYIKRKGLGGSILR